MGGEDGEENQKNIAVTVCPLAQKRSSLLVPGGAKKSKGENRAASNTPTDTSGAIDGGNSNEDNSGETGGDDGGEEDEENAGETKKMLPNYLKQITEVWKTMSTSSEVMTMFHMHPEQGILFFGSENLGSQIASKLMANNVEVVLRSSETSLPRFTELLRKAKRSAPMILILTDCQKMSEEILNHLQSQLKSLMDPESKILLLGCATEVDDIPALADMFESVYLDEEEEVVEEEEDNDENA